jgi:hypothetical protein
MRRVKVILFVLVGIAAAAIATYPTHRQSAFPPVSSVHWVLIAPPNPVMHTDRPMLVGTYASQSECEAAKVKAANDISQLPSDAYRELVEFKWVQNSYCQ